MGQITKREAIEKIKAQGGKIFTVTFIKKDGSKRVMNCRLHVRKGVKGVGMSYDPLERGLLPCFDMQKQAFRMINLKTILSLTFAGTEYIVL